MYKEQCWRLIIYYYIYAQITWFAVCSAKRSPGSIILTNLFCYTNLVPIGAILCSTRIAYRWLAPITWLAPPIFTIERIQSWTFCQCCKRRTKSQKVRTKKNYLHVIWLIWLAHMLTIFIRYGFMRWAQKDHWIAKG